MTATQNSPKSNTVTTNPVVTYLEKKYTEGREIADILEFNAEEKSSWGNSPATIAVKYADGGVANIALQGSLQAFLNMAYSTAHRATA